MSRSEFLNFCVSNAVILIVVYTLFIIFFVGYITKKVLNMKNMFDNYLTITQNSYQDFLRESNTIDKQSWQIKKNQEKAIIDINYILSLLDQYKGQKFNTEINHQVSNEILSKINENLKSSVNEISIENTKSIVENSYNDDLFNLYEQIEKDDQHEYSINNKIGINNQNRFSEIVENTIDFGQKIGNKLSKVMKNNSNDIESKLLNAMNNNYYDYDNKFMRELK
ncbi:MAG: hypothetical protein JXB50_08200 [Spirochaetes bacterium]|nr:hypothetical protein [Spirochaetota bacterium]